MSRLVKFIKRYKSYLVVLFFTLFSHALGFGREVSIAYLFGASSISDGLLIGLAPVTLFINMIGVGYANAAMARIKSLDNQRIVAHSYHPVLLAGLLSALVFYFFNHTIIAFTAPGIAGEGLLLATQIVQFSALSAGLAATYYWFRGIRHLEGQFLKVSISEIMPNIGIFIGILLLYRLLGVMGIAIGITVGYLLQLLVVFDRRRIDLSGFGLGTLLSSDAKTIYKNTFYGALGMSGVIVSLFVDRYFASQLSEGSVASINFAYKVMTLPLYTVVIAIITVMFPKMIGLRDHPAEYRRVRNKTSVILIGFGIVSSLGLIYFNHEIIALLFQYGKFGQSDVLATAPVLAVYAVGLTFHALALFHSKARYALEDFKTPLIAGTCAAVVNLVLDIVWVDQYGTAGLAAATSVGAAINAAILIFARQKQQPTTLGVA